MDFKVEHILLCVSSYIMLCCTIVVPKDLKEDEKLLFFNITSGYNTISRPVRNASWPVKLTFSLALRNILDLDGKRQILSTSIWIYEKWTDDNLRWSPAFFNNIKKIMIPPTYIWVPDIYIFNIAGSSLQGFINVTESKVLVNSDGRVLWSLPMLIKSACPVDATYFPYDKQICEIHFGSWIYDLSQIDIVLEKALPDLEHFVKNDAFDIEATSLRQDVIDSSCCPGEGKHPIVHLQIKLKRNTNYFDYIVIAPTLNLCVFTLATFLLPCECGWKIAIGLTVFLTLYVLQLLIAENVPDTKSTPLISIFLLLVMTLNCVSLITATIIMNIKRRSQMEPPPPVPKGLLYVCEHYLSKLVCVKLSDWKRIADDPTEFEQSMKKHVHEGSFQEDFLTDDCDSENTWQLFSNKNKSCNTRNTSNSIYTEIKPNEQKRVHASDIDCVRSHQRREPTVMSYTARSSSSHDIFIDEVPYTERLLHTLHNDISVTSPHERVNQSFQSDDNEVLESDTSYKETITAETTFVLPSFRKYVPKRLSYRRAIQSGGSYQHFPTRTCRRNLTRSVLGKITRKYQWYFVADVIDTMTFLLYIIVMFCGILTVLVIIPLFA